MSGQSFDSDRGSDSELTTAEIIANQSQDYIDERLLEYQQTIHYLADEQERVQKKTFTNWVNAVLARHIPPLKINDLIYDLRDGTKLLALLETLSGERLPIERGRRLRRPHFLSNVNTALRFLQSKRIKLVNINATDLVDGRPAVVLGLIWTIILYFQIEENTKQLEALNRQFSDSVTSLDASAEGAVGQKTEVKEGLKGSAKKALLNWVKKAIADYVEINFPESDPNSRRSSMSDVTVVDFGSCFRDGMVFLAIITCINPTLLDIDSFKEVDNRTRLETAFRLAESELGITRLLDPEDVDVPKPDEKSIMTYVAQFLHKYPDPKAAQEGEDSQIGRVEREYRGLCEWLSSTSARLSALEKPPHTGMDYFEYKKITNEFEQKKVTYEKLKQLVFSSDSSVGITQESWNIIQSSWLHLESQLRHWQWLLDSSLPGPWGQVGEWLSQAESLIFQELQIPEDPQEAFRFVSLKSEEHKSVFSDLPAVQSQFESLLHSPTAKDIPAPQKEDIAARLYNLGGKAKQREIKLRYLEKKYCLLALISLLEGKLQYWNVKYGKEDHASQLLEDYRQFMNIRNVYSEFEHLYSQLQQATEQYKREAGIDQAEGDVATKLLWDVKERWGNISVELRCAQSMLEEVLVHWARYHGTADSLEQWLGQATAMLTASSDDKLEFFQDLGSWSQQQQLLSDTANFLIASTVEPVAEEIKQRVQRINQQWDSLWPQVKQYMHSGEILKARKEYRAGQETLQTWIVGAENLLLSAKCSNTEAVRQYGLQLQQLQGEIEGMEDLFKALSKKFQTLVSELPPDDVEQMMWTLKKEKESLVMIHASIPNRLFLFHQLLTQYEALDQGFSEITQWLNDAENFLRSQDIPVSNEDIQRQLEKHKAFFSRTLYYKTMLDSKNKLYANIIRSASADEELDLRDLKCRMDELNARFLNLTANSHTIEQGLTSAAACWQRFIQCEKAMSDWLNNAKKMFTDKTPESKQGLEAHKAFFNFNSDELLRKLVNSGQDLQNSLPPQDESPVEQRLKQLQESWQEVTGYAPLHLLKLEFRLDEATFFQYVREIEKELSTERSALSKNENVQELLEKHKEFFKPLEESIVNRIETSIINLERLYVGCTQLCPEDKSLKDELSRCQDQWVDLQAKIKDMGEQLQQIPEQWRKYQLKFDEIVTWMNEVEQNLQSISREVDTADQFEQQKAKFQEICRNVDSKREDMKWLVQMLDSLISHKHDDESLKEQKHLEELINRYKSLIPTIELTLVRTDLHSKCYAYREEVQLLCGELVKASCKSTEETFPESLDEVEQLLSSQENLLQQLDEKRASILSNLQRGKDFQRDANVPTFIKEEVHKLEVAWNDAYSHTTEKLKKLRGTQKVWLEYKDQKSEILKLLQQAEEELRKITGKRQHDPTKMAADIKSKRELSEKLRQTTMEMIEKLKSLCIILKDMASPHKSEQLQKEVRDIETKMQEVLDTMSEKIKHMEKFATKWSSLSGELEKMKTWMKSAQKLLDRLVASDMNPEERMKQTQELQQQILEKLQHLNALEKETDALATDEAAVPEAEQLAGELSVLKDHITGLQHSVEKQKYAATEDLSHWEQYQQGISQLKPWLEEAESIATTGPSKPVSLTEAKETLLHWKGQQKECQSRLAELEGIALEGKLLAQQQPFLQDEVDALRTRWNGVRDLTCQYVEQFDQLVVSWEEVIDGTDKMQAELAQIEVEIVKPFNYSTPKVEVLEVRQHDIKGMNKLISDQQTQLLNLTQEAEQIFPLISPEGSNALKGKLTYLRSSLTKLGDEVRDHQNKLADAVVERQEFQKGVERFKEWLNDCNTRVARLEKVHPDKLDVMLNSIQSLQQEVQDKQPDFNLIYDQIKTLSTTCPPEDVHNLNQQYTKLSETYKKLEDTLGARKDAVQKWIDFAHWFGDIDEQAKLKGHQIEAQKVAPVELENLSKDIANLEQQCIKKQGIMQDLENVCKSGKILVAEKATEQKLEPPKMILGVLTKLATIKKGIAAKNDQMKKLSAHWEDLNSTGGGLLHWVEDAKNKVVNYAVPNNEITGIEGFINLLEGTMKEMTAKQEERDKFNQLAAAIIQDDSSQVATVQESVQQLDSEWDNLQTEVINLQTKYAGVVTVWKQSDIAKDIVEKALNEASKILPTLEDVTCTASETQSLHDKCKKALESTKKIRPQLDLYCNKSKHVAHQLGQLKGFNPSAMTDHADKLEEKWTKLVDVFSKKVQNLESQIILWQQLEQNKDDLMNWLSDSGEEMSEILENFTDLEHAKIKLEKYKLELPVYKNTYEAISNKMAQLKKLNDGKDIPTLSALDSLIKAEFVEVSDLAGKLEASLGQLGEKGQEIKSKLKDLSDWLGKEREILVKCEDASVDDASLLKKLESCKGVLQELDNEKGKFEQLEGEVKALKETFQSCDVTPMKKDIQQLEKRYQTLVQQGGKVSTNICNVLMKHFEGKLEDTRRFLNAMTEKLNWCNPSTANDSFGLESKLTTANDLEAGLSHADSKKRELGNGYEVMKKVAPEEKLQEYEKKLDKLEDKETTFKEKHAEIKEKLINLTQLWQQYELISENFSSWLKENEGKVRNEISTPYQVTEIQKKLSTAYTLLDDLKANENELKDMTTKAAEITENIPDARLTQQASALEGRYVQLIKNLETYLAKLKDVHGNIQEYQEAVNATRNWLRDAGEKLEGLDIQDPVGGKGTASYASKLKALKEFQEEKRDGQALLNRAIELGEGLFAAVSLEGRDAIRTELRGLRNDWEKHLDKVSEVQKKYESIIMALSSFDESANQFSKWIKDCQQKIGPELEGKPSLHEKKVQVQNYKLLLQDIQSHQSVASQLEKKASDLPDSEAAANISGLIKDYHKLNKDAKDRIALAEGYIMDHEGFQQSYERFMDWLNNQKSELVLCMDLAGESDSVYSKIEILEQLTGKKGEGEKMLGNCKEHLEKVKVHTHPSGHGALDNEYETLNSAWNSYLNMCEDAKQKLQDLLQQWNDCESLIANLANWLKIKESQVKDTSLKSSLESKIHHLEKIKVLGEEVRQKEDEFSNATNRMQTIESDSRLAAQAAQLNLRYQSLKNAIIDIINRYEYCVKEHQSFNGEYQACSNWLSDIEKKLLEFGEIVGDLKILQERRSRLENLQEARCSSSSRIDGVIELGERLYSHTAPDGRELIRQQLRTLRERWDGFTDSLNAACYRLDQCLHEFMEFSGCQEQLSKWLKEVEQAMQQHTELRATLQEKQAQYQNHKIMHGEIVCHNVLVESVCEKARHLVDQTQDTSLHMFIASIKQLFHNIGVKSKDLLEKLDLCVSEHTNLTHQQKAFWDWFYPLKEQLRIASDTQGEKADLLRKLDSVKELKAMEVVGSEKVEALKTLCTKVCASTSPKGAEVLQKDLQSLIEAWSNFTCSFSDCEEELRQSLKQWEMYEELHEQQNAWFRDTESTLHDKQLCATLQEKVGYLEQLAAQRQKIVEYEQNMDRFVDSAHSLLQMSSVDRLKPVIQQVSNRYQALHLLSKELLNKWQVMVEEHKNYEEKFKETSEWIESLEKQLAEMLDESNPDSKEEKLKRLGSDKENGAHKLENLISMGEKLYPNTAASGRETIRQELRDLRERWERLEQSLLEQHKKQEAQHHQWNLYADSLSQTRQWLEGVEQAMSGDLVSNWLSIQEIRSKLVRQRALLQDVVSHRRAVENIKERSAVVATQGSAVADDVLQQVEDLSQRYEALTQNIKDGIGLMEWALDNLQQFHEQMQTLQEWQKGMWDRLASLSDNSGNKPTVASRLDKIQDMISKVGDGSTLIQGLTDRAAALGEKIPQRSKETLDREINNCKYELEKLRAALDDAKRNLNSRLQQWNDYEGSFDRLYNWLAESEALLKDFQPKSTLEEKQEQLEKYQGLMFSLKQKDPDIDKMTDDSSELGQMSGETRISVNVQQITSRFQAMQITVKEIVKKCEQSTADHKAYLDKYNQFVSWLSVAQENYTECTNIPGSREDLEKQNTIIQELLSQKPQAMSLLNTTIEYGEKLYPTTSMEGRETIRVQLQDLQQTTESLFDNIGATARDVVSKLSRWTGYEEISAELKTWLEDTKKQIPDEIELKPTLDEKRAQLHNYRVLLQDIINHKQMIVDCKSRAENLPEMSEDVKQFLDFADKQHQDMLKQIQNCVDQYEAIVSDHSQYTKNVQEVLEWLDATSSTIEMWGASCSERIALHGNLERLKNLMAILPEEEARVKQIQSLGEKVIPGTSEAGQVNIRNQIDACQQEWQGLLSHIKSMIDGLDGSVVQWDEYEEMREKCQTWLRDTDTILHGIDLKATLAEKQKQLNNLKNLQGEVRAKELEIDAVTDRAQQLYKGFPNQRTTQISELSAKYQQVSARVKDLNSRWLQYVTNHQELEREVEECKAWFDDISQKLTYCSDLSATNQEDLESKLVTIQDLLMYRDEGFAKVQSVVEQAQTVLANTAPSGHEAINQTVEKLQTKWSALASKMVEIKTNLDDAIHRWAGFLEQVHQINKTVEHIQAAFEQVSQFQGTMSEKRAQLERLKSLEEKLRCEKYEVDTLKSKAAQMLASGQQTHAASQANEILRRFETLADEIKTLRHEREEQYKDHRHYKEATDDLLSWISKARDKMPVMKSRSLGDKLVVESAVTTLEGLLNKQGQGQMKLEQVLHRAEVLRASTSPAGNDIISSDIQAITDTFYSLFKDIRDQKDSLEGTVKQWREYKEEYERLSDWLQQADANIKAYKTILLGTVGEKEAQVNDMKNLVERLDKEEEFIEKLNKTASGLLTSHLDTYVNNQLRHLNSRYQVQVNLGKDVLKKLETTLEQHQQFDELCTKAEAWMDKARVVVHESSTLNAESGREALEKNLQKIQEILRRQEDGQALVHAAVNWGEKAARSSRSDGREAINQRLKAIQNDWERLIRKLSDAKVSVETLLLQWADYSSSYIQLQDWITEKESKLQKMCEQRVTKARKGLLPGMGSLRIGERKATLRRTNSFVQDIVSFKPMIEKVACKAEDLKSTQASEISNKYQTLSKQAEQIYAKQKEAVEYHQSFIDAGNDLMNWLRVARDKLAKCAEPTGDKDSLSSKVSQLKVLHSEQEEGQGKLEVALKKGEEAISAADEEDKEILEEEVANLQDEFDNYINSLGQTKNLLEVGIAKWKEYEDHYEECTKWLTETEGLVQGFNKLQDSLQEKRDMLEKFQRHLQAIFDWQKELDKLNMRAQLLLETCADSRVSNCVTQMTTKYNTLLSMAKEIMRRLECHFQEHQQHQSLQSECEEWIEKTKEKLEELSVPSDNLEDLENKLQGIKSLKETMEQGQHKLRYVTELKDRVIMNTKEAGAAQIQEDTEALRQEFEKLLVDLQEARQKIISKISQVEDKFKVLKLFIEWLEEIEAKAQADAETIFNDVSEKKATLELYKALSKDVAAHEEPADRLKELAHDKPDSKLATDIEDVLKRFTELKHLISSRIEKLEQQVKEYDQYWQWYLEASDWLRKTKIDLQHCADSHGDQVVVVDKLQKIHEITDSLSRGDEMVKRTVQQYEIVKATTGADGQANLNQEIEQLKHDWEVVTNASNNSARILDKCLKAWEEFHQVYGKMEEWLKQFQIKVDSEQSGEKTIEDLERIRGLLTEANSQKILVEDLSDKCEVLMEMSAFGKVRDQTVQLQAQYTTLLSAAQALVAKVEKNMSDHTEYTKAKEDFEAWLRRAEGTLNDSTSIDGEEEVIRERLETLKILATRITEGQHMLSVLSDMFTKALNTTPPERQEELKEQLTQLRDEWDKLNKDLPIALSDMKLCVSRWEDFTDNRGRLGRWLEEMQERLEEQPDSKGEVAEMKTLFERYKLILAEIESKTPEVETHMSEAEELGKRAKKPAISEGAAVIQRKWDALQQKCKHIIADIDLEIQEWMSYHGALQDTEKWLLQISFQLMAHNSLYISSHDQVQELMDQHQVLMEEIQGYQTTLDDVKAKGHQQIDRYICSVPSIQNTIEKQLHNIQESYDSLLTTGTQIMRRLSDSLQKFSEYETILQNITENLNKWEPGMSKELEYSVQTLDGAKKHLNIVRRIHNQLQEEKARLQAAVQACEAATAAVSRPSSPQDILPLPVPERELTVRVRLEDWIDQIQNHISSVKATVKELEGIDEAKHLLENWMQDQFQAVADFRNRCIRLRPEAAQHELKQVNDLREAVIEKQATLDELELKQVAMAPEATPMTPLKERLAKLDSEVCELVDAKLTAQNIVTSYRTMLNEMQAWYEQQTRKLDALDRGEALDSKQKLLKIQEMNSEYESEKHKVNNLKSCADKVMNVIAGMDQEQVEDQVKAMEKKYGDLKKRIARKAQIIELARQGYDDCVKEVGVLEDWLKGCLQEIQADTLIGYTTHLVEQKLQEVVAIQKEADGKKLIMDTLDRQAENMKGELENSEWKVLDEGVDRVKEMYHTLKEKAKERYRQLQAKKDDRQRFEDEFIIVEKWLQAKEEELKHPVDIPLKAHEIEKLKDKAKITENDIKSYEETAIAALKKQIAVLSKDSDEEQIAKLKEIEDGIQDSLDHVNCLLGVRTTSLVDALAARKGFEEKSKRCDHWLHQADVQLSADIRTTSLDVMQEQLQKYEEMNKEAAEIGELIQEVNKKGAEMLPGLTDPEKLTLQETMNTLKSKHGRVTKLVQDRLKQVKDAMLDHQSIMDKIKDCMEFLKNLQEETKSLNKPIGWTVEDAQGMLESYQDILDKIQSLKRQVDELQSQCRGNIPELTSLQKQQEDLILNVENQISKIRQLLIMRQQFMTLVQDIVAFLGTHTDLVKDIHQSDRTINEKISKYDEVMVKIQECEALLTSAQDKGDKISSEGSAQDRNTVMEQLQTLRQQLQALKRNVIAKKEEYEMMAAEHKKLLSTLEEAVDWLHQLEGEISSRPLLTVQAESAERELEKHLTLKRDAETHLQTIESILNSLEGQEEGLPAILREKLSEANGLKATIPRELDEREQYLQTAKSLRIEFESLVDRINLWIEDAAPRVRPSQQGLDYDNCLAQLEAHKTWLLSEQEVRDALQKLQMCADTINSSLPPQEQDTLSLKVQQESQSLKNTGNLARNKQAELEKAVRLWRDYLNLLERLQMLTSQADVTEEQAATIPALKVNRERVERSLRQIQSEQSLIEELNDKGKNLIKSADEQNKEKISQQLSACNDQWQEATGTIKAKMDELSALISKWESFDGHLSQFEIRLAACEHKDKEMEPQSVISIDRLKVMLADLKKLLAEVSDLGGDLEKIEREAKPVLDHLKKAARPVHDQTVLHLEAVDEKLQNLIEGVAQKVQWITDEVSRVDSIDSKLRELKDSITQLNKDVEALVIWSLEDADTEETLKELEECRAGLSSKLQKLSESTSNQYSGAGHPVPEDISKQLSSLELLLESAAAAMDEAGRELKRARTVRYEYGKDVESVQSWIQEAETKLEDKSLEPHVLKEYLQQIQCEIGTTSEQLDRVMHNGHTLLEKTNNQSERDLVKTTMGALTDQLTQVRQLLEDRKAQIGDSLDSWQHFLELYNSLKDWISKQKQFLQEPLAFSTLPDAKQALQEYSNVVKECKCAGKKVTDMARELNRVQQVSSAGVLQEKMAEAEASKAEVETELVEKLSLLSELTEEWEQCGKKMRDILSWLDKTRSNLESPQSRKRPLRDQLALREKAAGDAHIQKTKLSMAIEKLEVHFRTGIGADAEVLSHSADIIKQLDELASQIKDQSHTLEQCIAQIDQYQQEIVNLRQQMTAAEHQLRIVSSPTYSPDDRDKQLQEQNEEIGEITRATDALDRQVDRLSMTTEEQVVEIQRVVEQVEWLTDQTGILETNLRSLPTDPEQQSLLANIEGIKTRLLTILSQANRANQRIQMVEKEHAVHQQELVRYQGLLQELEGWLQDTSSSLNAELSLTSVDVIKHQLSAQELIWEDLARREEQLGTWLSQCEQLQKHEDVEALATQLYKHLLLLKAAIEDARTQVADRRQALQV